MGVSNFPGGFAQGVTIRGVPLTVSQPGEVFWVNNSGVLAKGGVGGSNGNDGSYRKPFASIDYAIGRCTASRGDLIMVMPGHSETISAAAGLVADVAGVAIVGVGTGSLQPQIRFTAEAADIDITAANVTFYNIRFTAAFADVASAIDIGAAAHNLSFLSCTFDEEASAENYVVVANIADGADGLWVEDCEYRGNDASNDHFLEFAGTHENVRIINNRMIHGTAQTATVAMIESGTAQLNMLIKGNYFHSESAAVAAAFVVLTGTTNTGWAVDNVLSHVDADATAANSVSAFDVTGLGSFNNLIAATGDIQGVEFATAEDLT
jgi:hypothetical protein